MRGGGRVRSHDFETKKIGHRFFPGKAFFLPGERCV